MNFTEEINLNAKEKKFFIFFRIIHFALFCAAFAYFVLLVLFPKKESYFDFTNPNSSKNTVIDPRVEGGGLPEKGGFLAGNSFYFDAVANGIFSEATIEFKMRDAIASENLGNIEIRRAYRAFLYPDGEPLGFRDGSLIRAGEDKYIISGGKRRRFSVEALNQLGFKEASFKNVAESDLDYNPSGQDVISIVEYPDSSIFLIENIFYILREGLLRPFVSRSVYLSRYAENQAIAKNSDFLQKYPISREPVGFSDGSLISYGESVYIASKEKIYPIDNPVTFESKGFAWEDVIPVNGEEISIYAKEKLFNINKFHPDGSIFKDDDQQIWYLVDGARKRPIFSESIAQTWLSKKPIAVSSASLDVFGSCDIREDTFRLGSVYACSASLEALQKFPGFDYEFIANFQPNSAINEMDVTFKRKINYSNLRSSVANLLNQIGRNYGLLQ